MRLILPILITLTLYSALTSATENGCRKLMPSRSTKATKFEPTDEQVREIFRRLVKITPMNPRAIRIYKPNPQAEAVIAEVLGQPAKISRVYNYALKKKPYKEWLIEAGIHPDTVFRAVDPLSPEMIIKALKALMEAGHDVSSGNVNQRYIDKESTLDLIEQSIGRRIYPSQLHYAATGHHNKSWDWWLIEAGMDWRKVRKWNSQFHASEEQILKAFIHLKISGVNTHRYFMQGNKSDPVGEKVLLEIFGERLTLAFFCDYILRVRKSSFGIWNAKANDHIKSTLLFHLSPASEYFQTAPERELQLIAKIAEYLEVHGKFNPAKVSRYLNSTLDPEISREEIMEALKPLFM